VLRIDPRRARIHRLFIFEQHCNGSYRLLIGPVRPVEALVPNVAQGFSPARRISQR
jgi:hypothetical protein